MVEKQTGLSEKARFEQIRLLSALKNDLDGLKLMFPEGDFSLPSSGYVGVPYLVGHLFKNLPQNVASLRIGDQEYPRDTAITSESSEVVNVAWQICDVENYVSQIASMIGIEWIGIFNNPGPESDIPQTRQP